MNTSFSDKELQFAKGISNVALANSAESLSKMVKDEVLFQGFELYPHIYVPEIQYKSYNLVSKIVGEFQAETHLIISKKDAPKICEVLLPASVAGQAEMREAVLLELTNIITASMITKFSNALKANVYGDVPAVYELDRKELESFLEDESVKEQSVYTLHTYFTSLELDLNLGFVSFFQPNFHKVLQERLSGARKAPKQVEVKQKKSIFKKLFDW